MGCKSCCCVGPQEKGDRYTDLGGKGGEGVIDTREWRQGYMAGCILPAILSLYSICTTGHGHGHSNRI